MPPDIADGSMRRNAFKTNEILRFPTDDNRFVITFPTGLTSQRFMYPKEEMDMICFSSAEVVAEGSNVPMQTYKPDGVTADQRRYTGLRATLANGNGMRLLALVNGQYIFNSDINLD